MKRKCEACHSGNHVSLHRQEFIVPDVEELFGYTVCACMRCGFLFADDVSSPAQYEEYYKTNSKYAYDAYTGGLPEGLKKIHRDSFSSIVDFIEGYASGVNRDDYAILDVGCSTGYLLHLFKEAGYVNLLGVEPAPRCVDIAKRLYGIKVTPSLLSELKNADQYNLLILSGVLEHTADLSAMMNLVHPLIKDGGVIFILVPDVMGFQVPPIEPFHEFSIEHINYFTAATLGKLLERYGFKTVRSQLQKVGFYSSAALRLFAAKVRSNDESITPDPLGISMMRSYIEASTQKLQTVQRSINSLIDTREDIVIWGCGSLTSRLLASTPLLMANIKAFIDSDRNLHGRRLAGVKIRPPDWLAQHGACTLFISSYVYGKEIRDMAVGKFGFTGKTVLLE